MSLIQRAWNFSFQSEQQKKQDVIYYFEIRAPNSDQSVRPTSFVRKMFSLPLV